jgi:hypothetical protein
LENTLWSGAGSHLKVFGIQQTKDYAIIGEETEETMMLNLVQPDILGRLIGPKIEIFSLYTNLKSE